MHKILYMKKSLLLIAFCGITVLGIAQSVDSICFHLYTDSLKKSVYNYINVDGKLSNGRYIPLGSKEVKFTSSYGRWDGNSLIIDPSYRKDSVVVTASLIAKPSLTQTVTIYIKKKEEDEVLPTIDEVMHSKPQKRH